MQDHFAPIGKQHSEEPINPCILAGKFNVERIHCYHLRLEQPDGKVSDI
ncbi:MAG: hypothetical protein R3E79_40030 [Caldilineaceae bacterium]